MYTLYGYSVRHDGWSFPRGAHVFKAFFHGLACHLSLKTRLVLQMVLMIRNSVARSLLFRFAKFNGFAIVPRLAIQTPTHEGRASRNLCIKFSGFCPYPSRGRGFKATSSSTMRESILTMGLPRTPVFLDALLRYRTRYRCRTAQAHACLTRRRLVNFLLRKMVRFKEKIRHHSSGLFVSVVPRLQSAIWSLNRALETPFMPIPCIVLF